MHDYPLSLRFKLIAIANQIYVLDKNEQEVCYVKQKAFKLKENVRVFKDSSQQEIVCTIVADSIIDFNVAYELRDASENVFGAVRRKGRKSIFKAHYEILKDSQVDMTIDEENPMAKVFDSILGQLPFIGAMSAFLFHPKYLVSRTDGRPVVRLTKLPSFFERRFQVDLVGDMQDTEELRVIAAVMMMIVREGERG